MQRENAKGMRADTDHALPLQLQQPLVNVHIHELVFGQMQLVKV